ncbi:hypothetical protein [Bradyrhizobium sp. Cp5.3]|uniref:hypothetical protein n=1 Tax=Bradyrhizobium sp. Cp5.3 TaxID=443598 RepID=UPI000484C2DD|nr:hypothetical protein [Bradyrhizobium sp. Cp5.3]
MSQALRRFEDLKQKFRRQIRARKLSAVQRYHVISAASKQQIAEVTIAEMVLGAPHDRGVVDRLQAEVRQHLTLAGAKPPRQETGDKR